MNRSIGAVTRALLPCFVAGAGLLRGADLIDAVRNDDPAAAAALVKKRADVNAREEDGATALAWAAIRGNIESATLLLKAGANPNLTNEQGIGPLYLAITNGAPAVAQLLLEKGADPNVARDDGET